MGAFVVALAKFALMQDTDLDKRIAARAATADVTKEALQLLIILGHKRPEAGRMVQEAIAAQPDTAGQGDLQETAGDEVKQQASQ